MGYVSGLHAVQAALSSNPERVRSLHVQKGRHDDRIGDVVELAKAAGIRVRSVDKRWLDQHSDVPHQGVVADCHDLRLGAETDLEAAWSGLAQPPLLLVLDGVADPRNFGACLRSAAGAGVDAVLFPKRRSAPVNDVVLKTAAGGAESLRLIEVANLARRLKWLQEQGVWLVGTSAQAPQSWYEVDLKVPTAIVVGSEGDGMRALTARHCDYLVSIPMSGALESLNVSVATGILLFEAVRQRSG